MTIQEMINLLIKEYGSILIECDETGIIIWKERSDDKKYLFSEENLEETLKEAVKQIRNKNEHNS